MQDMMDEQLIVVIAGNPDPELVKDLEVLMMMNQFIGEANFWYNFLQEKTIEYKVVKYGEILGDGLGTNYLYVIRDFEGDYFDKLRKHKKRIFGITAMKQSLSCVENMVTKQVLYIFYCLCLLTSSLFICALSDRDNYTFGLQFFNEGIREAKVPSPQSSDDQHKYSCQQVWYRRKTACGMLNARAVENVSNIVTI